MRRRTVESIACQSWSSFQSHGSGTWTYLVRVGRRDKENRTRLGDSPRASGHNLLEKGVDKVADDEDKEVVLPVDHGIQLFLSLVRGSLLELRLMARRRLFVGGHREARGPAEAMEGRRDVRSFDRGGRRGRRAMRRRRTRSSPGRAVDGGPGRQAQASATGTPDSRSTKPEVSATPQFLQKARPRPFCSSPTWLALDLPVPTPYYYLQW